MFIQLGGQMDYLWQAFSTELLPSVISITSYLALPSLAIILGIIFVPLWLAYVRAKNFLKEKYVVLEIKLPKENFKSPLAMELFFHSIHNTADGNFLAKWTKGEVRPWYSFEIISVEGIVKFMVWTEAKRKVNLMSALYAQFPGIEIYEVDDYAKSVHYDRNTMKVWAVEFKFTKDNPYPLKTYVDYGLDKDPKEEFKVDPLVPILEFLGSVGPNQQIWIQFMVRAHKDDQRKPGSWWKTTDLVKDKAKEIINKELMKRDEKSWVAGKKDEKTGKVTPPTLSEGEKETISAIERKISKFMFDVGIRAIYFGEKESFVPPFGIGGIIGGFKNFSSDKYNGFKPNGKKWFSKLEYPWQDFHNIRKHRFSNLVLLAYKMRSFFYAPFQGDSIVMNTEELATLYHFPGSVAITPTLERVPSKKSEAPANLPT